MKVLLLPFFFLCFGAAAVSAEERTLAEKNFTISEKEEFRVRMEKELALAKRDIEVLKNEVVKKGSSAKQDLQAELRDLEKKRLELGKQIDQLSKASSSAWTELRKGAQAAYKELSRSVEQASKEVRKAN